MNSLYISHHPTASRAFALAVFRDLRARGLDALLAIDGTADEALALARSADAMVVVITPASAASLGHAGRQTAELALALEAGQPVLGLFAYGAAPGDAAFQQQTPEMRAALSALPVIAPPLTNADALTVGLDYLHGQLIALFENSGDDGAAETEHAALAREALQRALRLPAPEHEALLAEAWYNRALTARDSASRLAALDRAVDLQPDYTQARFERGALRLRLGDAAGAKEDFDATALTRDEAQVWVLRGQARRQLGDLAGAATDFTLAIDRDPALAVAYSGRGLSRKALGDLRGALADFTAALERSQPTAALYINRGLTHKALAENLPGPQAQPMLEAARLDYDAALALDPGSATALNNRGVVRLQLGDVPGAIADLDAALERDPGYSSAQRNRMAAEQALRRAAASESRAAAETHVNLALALAHGGLIESALNELGEALELDPSSADAHHARARLRAAQSDRDGAFEDFARVIELSPANALAYADRAELFLADGELDKAARDLTRAIRAAPGNAHYLLRRGIVRSEAGDYARALEDFTASLERNDAQALTYYHRGLAHAALNDFDAAIADYNAALRIDPELADAYLNRGLARAAKHQPAATRAAIEDLKLYLVQTPGDDRAEIERILRVLEHQQR